MAFIKFSQLCIFAATAVASAAAVAQVATPSTTEGLTEIIVTAQKRAENLQDVPVAVTALSGDELAARGVTDVQEFSRLVPNMNFSDSYNEVRISLRGLSFEDLATQAGEPRVAYHVDGAYVSEPAAIGGTFFDINRVEVNRGPQGTLFGRNAIAGTVNVITNDPTDTLSGYVNAELGNYSTMNFDGAISGPLSDGISGRIAFQTRNHSGYDYNVTNNIDVNNKNTQAFRAKIKFNRLANFTATLSADYAKEDDRSGLLFLGVEYPTSPLAGIVPGAGGQNSDGNPRHDFSALLPNTAKTVYGFGLDTKLEMGNSFSLVSLLNYRNSKFNYVYDDEGSNLGIIRSNGFEFVDEYSGEFRLEKDFSRGNIVLGTFLYKQDYRMQTENPFSANVVEYLAGIGIPLASPAQLAALPGGSYTEGFKLAGDVSTRSIAVFGQAAFDLTDTTKLIAGARYTDETKRLSNNAIIVDFGSLYNPSLPFAPGNFVPNAHVSYNKFSPRITLEQKLGPHQLVYLTYAKGFKAGGFNVSAPGSPPYLPETLTDYEAGFKVDLLDRKLRINTAGFYYDYSNLQETAASFTTNSNVNAVSARLYGVEAEITVVPAPGLEIDFSPAWLHSAFRNFSVNDPNSGGVDVLDGKKFPLAPNYTLSYGAQYAFNSSVGEITLRGDGQSKGRTYFDFYNILGNSERPSTILNASIGWKSHDDRLSASIFAKNITNGLYKNGAFVQGGVAGWPIIGSYDPPRTYGVRFGVKF